VIPNVQFTFPDVQRRFNLWMERCQHGPLDQWNMSLEMGLQATARSSWLSVHTWAGAIQAEADEIEGLANDLWHLKNLQLYVRRPLCRGQWQQVCVLTQEIFSTKATLLAWLAIAHSKYDFV
jgi:hypothetical protein